MSITFAIYIKRVTALTIQSFQTWLAIIILRTVIVIFLILLVFISWALWCKLITIISLTLFSSERLWGFHIFQLFSTFWRFGNIFYFFIIVITISSHVIQIFVGRDSRFTILVFVGEIKFNKKLSIFFTFHNVSFCVLFTG